MRDQTTEQESCLLDLSGNWRKRDKKYLDQLLADSGRSIELILRRLPHPLLIKTVADIGSGYGTFSISLALKGIKATAIEPSKSEREIASSILKRHAKAKKYLRIINAKAEKLPLSNNSFDFCILSQVLEHVESPARTIKEASRILKLGGYLYLGSPNYIFPVEQHYRLLYFPFMPKELLYRWVLFYFKYFKKQNFKNKDLLKTKKFVKSLNYTNHKMIKSLFEKNHLKIYWFVSNDNTSVLQQINNHWRVSPSIKSIPLIMISIPVKIVRLLFNITGLLPRKLEYLVIKVE